MNFFWKFKDSWKVTGRREQKTQDFNKINPAV